ncbi:MAG: WG repeat-containing protein [Bacteroidales bacterium]|nr:WG repeat-containing protein [Bacteroidales bacterium]
MHIRKTVTSIILTCLAICANAQVARWVIAPEYTSIEPISSNMLRVGLNGGYGLIDYSGNIIISPQAERITDMAEGISLVLAGERLLGLVFEDGHWEKMQAETYIDPAYPYFSDGLLAVRNAGGKWTLMDRNRKVLFNPKYKYIGAFVCNGARAIFKNGAAVHIDRNGTVKKLGNGFTTNEMVFSSSFTRMGSNIGALVVDSGNNVSLRDLNGVRSNVDFGILTSFDKNARIMKTTRYRSIEFAENWQILRLTDNAGKVTKFETTSPKRYEVAGTGLTSSNRVGGYNVISKGKVILQPQFDAAIVTLSPTMAIAEINGRVGVLEVIPGYNPEINFPEEAIVFRHHVLVEVIGNLAIPSSLTYRDYSVSISGGNTTLFEGSPRGGQAIIPFLPSTISDSGELDCAVEMTISGLKYPKSSGTIRWKFENAFSVSAPGKVKLNKSNTAASFSVTIKNDSDVASDECDIFVDGVALQRGVVFEGGESKSFTVTKKIDIEDLDSVTRTIGIQVRETGCPIYKASRRITFDRSF